MVVECLPNRDAQWHYEVNYGTLAVQKKKLNMYDRSVYELIRSLSTK